MSHGIQLVFVNHFKGLAGKGGVIAGLFDPLFEGLDRFLQGLVLGGALVRRNRRGRGRGIFWRSKSPYIFHEKGEDFLGLPIFQSRLREIQLVEKRNHSPTLFKRAEDRLGLIHALLPDEEKQVQDFLKVFISPEQGIGSVSASSVAFPENPGLKTCVEQRKHASEHGFRDVCENRPVGRQNASNEILVRLVLFGGIQQGKIGVALETRHLIGQSVSQHAVKGGVVFAALHSKVHIPAYDVSLRFKRIKHVLYFVAEQEFRKGQHLGFVECSPAKPRFRIAGYDKAKVVEDPFMDAESPALVVFGDQAHGVDSVLLVFHPTEGQVVIDPGNSRGIGAPFVSEIGHHPADGDGHENADDPVDALLILQR